MSIDTVKDLKMKKEERKNGFQIIYDLLQNFGRIWNKKREIEVGTPSLGDVSIYFTKLTTMNSTPSV